MFSRMQVFAVVIIVTSASISLVSTATAWRLRKAAIETYSKDLEVQKRLRALIAAHPPVICGDSITGGDSIKVAPMPEGKTVKPCVQGGDLAPGEQCVFTLDLKVAR